MTSILTIMGNFTCVISGVFWSTSYYSMPPIRFLRWRSGVMVRWFLMVQRWWWEYFVAEIQFWRWSEFYRWSESSPPGQFYWGTIVVGANFILPGQNPVGHIPWDGPGVFFHRENTWQNLTHYWNANFPWICLGISWYFCNYNDTDFISFYAKVCGRYGIFLYIRLQYVLGVCPNMSQGTRAPSRTFRTERRIIHVGFREIVCRKGARKVKELIILHLHFTPHWLFDIITVGIVIAVGVSIKQ